MSREEVIRCDNEDCQGGKHFKRCGNEHDICSLCWVVRSKQYFCPICFEKARLE